MRKSRTKISDMDLLVEVAASRSRGVGEGQIAKELGVSRSHITVVCGPARPGTRRGTSPNSSRKK